MRAGIDGSSLLSPLCPDQSPDQPRENGLQRVPLAHRAAHLAPTLGSGEHAEIGFDSGHGFPGLFPDMSEAALAALNEHRAETLQYAARPGLPDLRAWIAGYLGQAGAAVDSEEVLVVNGAKHGIELV